MYYSFFLLISPHIYKHCYVWHKLVLTRRFIDQDLTQTLICILLTVKFPVNVCWMLDFSSELVMLKFQPARVMQSARHLANINDVGYELNSLKLCLWPSGTAGINTLTAGWWQDQPGNTFWQFDFVLIWSWLKYMPSINNCPP